MIRVTFLGTAASRPTVGRGVSALAVQRESELMLFDCGEGTQRQMMRFGTGFGLGAIFVTHLHADHFLGIIGLSRTLSLQDRTETLHVYGPPGSGRTLRAALELGVDRVGFPVEIREMEPGDRVERDGYDIVAFATRHGVSSVGYAVKEHRRLGRFDPDRARELGVPEGPLFGRLHRGEPVEVDGKVIRPEEVVGEPRPGRNVVYTGDTRPCDTVREAAGDADLLVHDATFTEDERDRARETKHSTAAEAARVARDARVKRLLLTHVSARYSANPRPLEREARKIFRKAAVAFDGQELEIPFPERSSSGGGNGAPAERSEEEGSGGNRGKERTRR